MVDEDDPGPSVTRDLVRAFQLRRHHLDERIKGKRALLDVTGACGVQDSPPGSATVAIGARVAGLTADAVEHALEDTRTLVRTWAMRGAPFIVPTADLPVFTTGVLPVDEEARTNLIYGVRGSLDALSIGLDELVATTAAAVRNVLSGERLDINELGRQVADRIAPTLSDTDRAAWDAEGPHAKGQPVGEALVHFCVRLLTLQQLVCFGPRDGRRAPFVLVSEWLDDLPSISGMAARRELVIRYLRAYGPSSRAGLADWLGINSSDAAPWWALVEGDVTPVDVEGSRRWVLTDDLETLAVSDPERVEGVRLLPPGDPFLQVPDRDILVDDRERRQQLWRSLHAPGAVLVDGDIVGTWRSRKTSRALEVAVKGFAPLSSATREAVVHEARSVAAVRNKEDAAVEFVDR
ncbi:MAG TPA: winged helix DNA-binding domain-containing protein [Egicoccus sp.]|nr:winged helix DNA-binding domain-containing protein [Egicoccus sp.]HSK22369.1 winged helix DNA-binding domain-containing protein [Egicoccus sp.]